MLIFIWSAHFLHAREIRNSEMKFLLALECNHFSNYEGKCCNKANNICGHLIVTSNFPQKETLCHLKLIYMNINHFIFLNNQIFTNFSLLSFYFQKNCQILWQTWKNHMPVFRCKITFETSAIFHLAYVLHINTKTN